MLDIQFIRQNPDLVKDGIAKKQYEPSLVDVVLELDQKRRELLLKIEDLRKERNEIAKEQRTEETDQRGRDIKEELKTLEPQLKEVEEEYGVKLSALPNLPDEDVPVGPDETGNKPVRNWGEPKKFNFKPKDHVEIGENLGIIDIESASKISGTRFAYLKGDAVLLEFALVQFAFSVLTSGEKLKEIAGKFGIETSTKPFIPVVPPVMIKPDVFRKMARLDPGLEEERYFLPKDELYLVGSAEHTLGPLHMDETIPASKLPIRYVGFSTSFRREAGSYGKDTKGILRVHQFDKIEMESFTASADSRREQDFIVAVQEYLMQALEIPYQVVAICTGDMGGPDARQLDIESWMPGQDTYRETHTSDLMTDYQSRRLNTKVQKTDGTTELAHMNDATAFAIGRTIIAILENYQQKDGSIIVPDVLRPYMGKNTIEK